MNVDFFLISVLEYGWLPEETKHLIFSSQDWAMVPLDLTYLEQDEISLVNSSDDANELEYLNQERQRNMTIEGHHRSRIPPHATAGVQHTGKGRTTLFSPT